MPMVRPTKPMRCFCPAKTGSTAERIANSFAFALETRSGKARRFGFRWWMWLLNMPGARGLSTP